MENYLVAMFVFAGLYGLMALGLNVINMALVTALGGYLVFRGLRFLLPRLGTMGHRLFHDRTPPEVVAQRRFQRRDFPLFHE